MYKIIGANQTEYGPETVAQIRQWIAEGRINAQTLCQAAGETEWKPIAGFAPFADLFAPAGAPPLVAPPTMPPPLGGNFPNVNGRAKALEEVNGPAIGLIVTAALEIFSKIIGIGAGLTGATMPFQGFGQMNNLPPESAEILQFFNRFNVLISVIGGIIGLAVGIFIIYSALKMKRLENHGLCLAAAIVAIVPCFSPCCLLGIPFGIWALVVLNKPEIKSQFS